MVQNSLHDLSRQKDIYFSMLDLLVLLQQNIPSFSLKVYDNNLLLNELKLFTDWYILYRLKRNLSNIELDDFVGFDAIIDNQKMSIGDQLTEVMKVLINFGIYRQV